MSWRTYDRPQGRAESSADLVRAATPYLRLFRDPKWSCIEKATLSLHPAWVEKGRSGRCNTWVLTPRGRAIVERNVPACVRGWDRTRDSHPGSYVAA